MLTLVAEATPDATTVVLGVASAIYLVGVLGIVIPVLPGLVLCVAAVLLWAIGTTGSLAWTTFGIVLVIYALGVTLQFILPGRRMKGDGVGGMTLALGAVGAVIGFFVIPVIGLPIGFVLGIFGAEYGRFRDAQRAWSATRSALRGVLHSMGIELATALIIALVWTGGIALH